MSMFSNQFNPEYLEQSLGGRKIISSYQFPDPQQQQQSQQLQQQQPQPQQVSLIEKKKSVFVLNVQETQMLFKSQSHQTNHLNLLYVRKYDSVLNDSCVSYTKNNNIGEYKPEEFRPSTYNQTPYDFKYNDQQYQTRVESTTKSNVALQQNQQKPGQIACQIF